MPLAIMDRDSQPEEASQKMAHDEPETGDEDNSNVSDTDSNLDTTSTQAKGMAKAKAKAKSKAKARAKAKAKAKAQAKAKAKTTSKVKAKPAATTSREHATARAAAMKAAAEAAADDADDDEDHDDTPAEAEPAQAKPAKANTGQAKPMKAKPEKAVMPATGSGSASSAAVVKLEPHEYPPIPKVAAQVMNHALKRLSSQGQPELSQQFKGLKTQAAKRQFYYETYLMDPRTSKKSAKKDLEVEEVEDESMTKGWFTDDKIAGLMGFTPDLKDYDAKKAACVKGLPEKAHEKEELSNLGVKLYYYEYKENKSSNVKKRRVSLSEQVELEAPDFETARGQLQQSLPERGMPPPPKPNPKPDVPKHIGEYVSAHSKLAGLLSAVASLINKGSILKEKLQALEGQPEKANLASAYLTELHKVLPIISNSFADVTKEFAKYSKDIPKDSTEENAKKWADNLVNLHHKMSTHRQCYNSSLAPMLTFAGK